MQLIVWNIQLTTSQMLLTREAAKSRIYDSDIAKETSNLTKSQILQQAAQAMLKAVFNLQLKIS